MKNNQTMHQYKETYAQVKQVDINALRAFMYQSTRDIVDAIQYWTNRRITLLNKPEQRDQANIISVEIMRLESILLAKSQLTIDFFNISNLDTVIKDSEIISVERKHFDSNFPTTSGVNDLPFEDKTEVKTEVKEEAPKEEGKVIQMFPDKMKLSDLADKCKELLAEGKDEEANHLATKYLLSANYIPKKEKQKAEKWHEARVESWIADLKKSIKVNTKAAVEEPASSVTTDDDKDYRSIYMSVDSYDLVCKWLENKKVAPKDIFEEEMINPETRSKYKELEMLIRVENYERTVDELVALGVSVIEEAVENIFMNESNTLREEVQHIENLIKLSKELRGENEPQNLDKIEALAEQFFSARGPKEYAPATEFVNDIKRRPQILTTAKDFFSRLRYAEKDNLGAPHLIQTYQEGKNRDMYSKVISDIKDAYKEGDVYFEEEFLPELCDKLRGKILAGNSDKGNLENKAYLYTTYHVLHLVDAVVRTIKENLEKVVTGDDKKEEEKDKHPENDSGKLVATATEAVADASMEQETAQNELKKGLLDTFEESLLTLVKNGGVLEDALNHPSVVGLKGMTIVDPWETGNLELNEENFKKYVERKFDEIKFKYQEQLTSYPLEDVMYLLKVAYEKKITPENFAKDNIELLRKKDGSFLNLEGKLDEAVVEIPIKSFENFLKFVQESYELMKDNQGTVYELSKFKTFQEFEAELKVKIKEGLSLENIKEWAKSEVLDKNFENSVSNGPTFRKENPDGLDQMVDVIYKKETETPESLKSKEDSLKLYIEGQLKTSEKPLLSFMHNIVKPYCVVNSVDFNLAKLRDMIISLAKVHNTEMYTKYAESKASLQGKKLIPDTKPAETETPNQKEVIVESASEEAQSEEYESLLNDALSHEILSEKALKEALDNVTKVVNEKLIPKNPATLLKVVKDFVINKKQVKEMSSLSEADINEWVTDYLAPVVPAEAISDEQLESERSDYNNEIFDDLSNAHDKADFKKALGDIVSKFNDSNELRQAVITSIKQGKGNHTIKVARQTTVESHAMIKKAFENYDENKV